MHQQKVLCIFLYCQLKFSLTCSDYLCFQYWIMFSSACFSCFVLRIFSCEDAAQQVLMYVCPSVCPCVINLKIYLPTSIYYIQNVPECSRMHSEFSRMFRNAYRMFQNVYECMKNVPECMQNVLVCVQNVPECSGMFYNVPKCTR